MTRTEKIQAAIDALPNATGGDWVIDSSHNIRTPISTAEKHVAMVNFNHSGDLRDVSGEEHSANAALISAARELAEEVVRLRGLVEAHQSGSLERLREAYGFEKSLGDQIVDAVSRQSGIPRVELIKPIPKGSGDNALGPAAYARRLARHPKKRGEEPPMGQYDEEPL